MRYNHVEEAVFVSRPNRFIANVLLGGQKVVCHVKNTGRCKELLVPGARVFLEKSENPARKTAYDLIAVYKGKMLINMDSQAPNKVFYEWSEAGGFLPDVRQVRPETVFHDARLDCLVTTAHGQTFVEVKGVTLEKDGVVLFPDAPTQRGVKHLEHLILARQEGYGACLVLVAQLENPRCFIPNRQTDPAFADGLQKAARAGVQIRCVACRVTPDSLAVAEDVPVHLL